MKVNSSKSRKFNDFPILYDVLVWQRIESENRSFTCNLLNILYCIYDECIYLWNFLRIHHITLIASKISHLIYTLHMLGYRYSQFTCKKKVAKNRGLLELRKLKIIFILCYNMCCAYDVKEIRETTPIVRVCLSLQHDICISFKYTFFVISSSMKGFKIHYRFSILKYLSFLVIFLLLIEKYKKKLAKINIFY